MRKKIILIVLVVAIVIQLLVPVGMIAYSQKVESDFEKYGVEYKFKIDVESIYDETVYFDLDDGWYRWKSYDYGMVSIDGEGYAYFETFTDSRPPVHNYVRFTEDNNHKLRYFYIDKDAERMWVVDEEAYAIIKVFNGDIQVVDIIIDGMSVNEWVEIPPVTEENIEDEDLLF